MSLTEYPEVIQGTPEWDDLRRGMVTASVVGQLITPSTLKVASNPTSRGLTALLVAERITGWTDPTYVSEDMERGWEDEPRALAAYAEAKGVEVQEMGFMVLEGSWGRLGYSPDGLVSDTGLTEVKSRRAKKQLATILADEVPAENIAQIQAGLLVSGREWCDYISYAAGMPLYTKRVYPDHAWHKAIQAAVQAFEEAAAAMTEKYGQAVVGLPMTERLPQDMDVVVI
jgi:hypothetical protein